MATSRRISLRSPSRGALAAVAIIVATGGCVLWILSIERIVAGTWSSIIGAVCTIIGVSVALLQWLLPCTPLPISQRPARKSGACVSAHGQVGILRVKMRKPFCGVTINVCRGFDSPPFVAHAAASVIEHRNGYHVEYTADFYNLDPGNYTIYVDSSDPVGKVTVYAGHLVEVDWRHIHFINKYWLGRE